MADAIDWGSQFNTALTPAELAEYQAWLMAESARRGRDVTLDPQDYDLQGYWKDIGRKDVSGQGHMPDTYKKPNHPTFSDESKYHGAAAPFGKYVGGKWDEKGYTPSAEMLANTHDAEQMRAYFKKAEPEMQLRLPAQPVLKMATGGPVPSAFDPDAALAQLRAESTGAAVAPEGFDPDEALAGLREESLQSKYGGVGQQILTGLEGAGSGLTFGLSTHLQKALGADPERIKGREEANPEASLTGEVAGMALPILLSLGAAAPAEAAGQVGIRGGLKAAAELSAPSLISKAGGLAAKGAKALLPEAESIAGKLAVKGVAGAAQGSVEGGLWSAGHVVHESALDPNLTAQSALDEIRNGALFGGGLGGGQAVAGGVLGMLAKGAAGSKIGAKLGSWLEGFEGERNLKASGAIQSDISSAEKRISKEELNKMGREAGEMGIVTPWSSPAATLEKAQGVMSTAGKRMGDLLEAADGTLGAAPKPMEDIMGRIRKEVVAGMEESPFQQEAAARLANKMGAYEMKFAGRGEEAGLGFKDLHGIRREIDDELFGLRGNLDPGVNYYKAGLRDIRDIISGEIHDGIQEAGLSSKAWKEANREYQVAATIAKFAEKGSQRATGNNPLGLLSVIMGAAGFAGHGVPGGAVMGLGAEVLKRYGSGVAGAAAREFRQAGGLEALAELVKANQATGKRVADLAGSILSVGRGAVVPRLSHDEVQSRMEQTRQFVSNPEAATEALTATTNGLEEHAPNIARALQTTQARAASFLASKLPDNTGVGPLGKPLPINEQSKWQFGRYQAAVDRPTSILQHAAAGTLTPMDVEAVQAVHPQLLDSMRQAAIEKLTSHKGDVTYQQRLMLSLLLGQPVDSSMTPQAIMASQAVYQRPSAKGPENQAAPQGAARPSQAGLGKLQVGKRSRTPAQAAADRMDG